MYKVEIQKLKSNHNNIKSTPYTGQARGLPTVGESFLGPIYTTPVRKVQEVAAGHMIFQTENSTYELKYSLDDSN